MWLIDYCVHFDSLSSDPIILQLQFYHSSSSLRSAILK